MKASSARSSKQPGSELFRTIVLPSATGTPHPVTKGERTRLKLLQSALDTFRHHSFLAARVSDVCQNAGVSQGAFYIYFRDKEHIATELMRLLLERLTDHVLHAPHSDDPFETILESNRRYAEFFNQDGQFNRAVLQIFDALPEVKALSSKVNQAVAERVSESLRRRIPHTERHSKERLALAYTLLGMIDAIYLGYFSSEPSPMRELFDSSEELVEFASFVWYRTLFGCNPPARRASSKLLKVLDGFVMVPAMPAHGALRPILTK